MSLAWSHAGGSRPAGFGLSLAWLVPLLAAAIGGIGVLTLYSVGGGDMEPWAMRHVVRLVIGFAVMMLVSAVPVRFWLRVANPAYVLALGGLVAVLSHGTEALGAQRWLDLGPVSLQPSEVMKVALVLVLARFYNQLPPRSQSSLWAVGVPMLLVALPMLLIMKQPDLGTAILLASIGLALIFLSGAGLSYFAAGAAAAAVALPFLWEHLHDYQKQRILVFIDPAVDPLGKGYQIYQSKIALGSGGFAGKGLLQGTQSQLDFVPEKHTDFIFALWAEETGFLGGLLLIGLFLALCLCLIGLALRCRNVFGRLVIMGVTTSLFVHVAVNIAMVIGSAPVVGVPLPLVSYGGTSLFSVLFGLGLVLGAHRDRDRELPRSESGWLW